MSIQNFSDNIIPRIEELPGDLSQLAKAIEDVVPGLGVNIVLRVASEFRGTHIYFHNLDSITRKARNRFILEKYDKGIKVPEIARIVRLSERQVWTVLGKET